MCCLIIATLAILCCLIHPNKVYIHTTPHTYIICCLVSVVSSIYYVRYSGHHSLATVLFSSRTVAQHFAHRIFFHFGPTFHRDRVQTRGVGTTLAAVGDRFQYHPFLCNLRIKSPYRGVISRGLFVYL